MTLKHLNILTLIFPITTFLISIRNAAANQKPVFDKSTTVFLVIKDHPFYTKILLKGVPTPNVEVLFRNEIIPCNLQNLSNNPYGYNFFIPLFIQNPKRENSGDYTIKANNKYGNDELTIKINVLSCPSQPGTPKFDSWDSSSVHLHWEEPKDNGGTSITNYIIEKYENYRSQWISLNSTTFNNQNKGSVKNLVLGMPYQFRVIADNGVGRSLPSQISTTFTPGRKIQPQIDRTPLKTGSFIARVNEKFFIKIPISGEPKPTVAVTFQQTEEIWMLQTNDYDDHTLQYVIENVKKENNGNFYIKASNMLGSDQVQFYLKVLPDNSYGPTLKYKE